MAESKNELKFLSVDSKQGMPSIITMTDDNSHDRHAEFMSLAILDEITKSYCETENPYGRVIIMHFVNKVKDNVRERIKSTSSRTI